MTETSSGIISLHIKLNVTKLKNKTNEKCSVIAMKKGH